MHYHEDSTELACTIPTKPQSNKPTDNMYADKDLKANLFASETFDDCNDTLRYLMKSYGKVIHAKIIAGELVSFQTYIDPDHVPFWRRHTDAMGFTKGTIQVPTKSAVSLDNFVIRTIVDDEADWVRDMFVLLCESRTIEDCEFFVNVDRQSPMVTVDRSIADHHAAVKHLVDYNAISKAHTVLSLNTSDHFKDLAIPSYPDYQRIMNNQWGIEHYRSMKWEDKKAEFLYRGDALYPGLYKETGPLMNARLALVDFMKRHYSDVSNVGIIDFNENNPVLLNHEVHHFSRDKSLEPDKDFDLVSRFRYIFALDSVCSPEELSMLMFTGSCIIRVESEWKNWYDDLLSPGEHYVSVAADLSNLEEVVEWCIYNADECRRIGLNARAFAVKYLSKNGVLDYLEIICNRYVNRVRYPNISHRDIQLQHQDMAIRRHQMTTIPWSGKLDTRLVEQEYKRSWAWNKALSMLPNTQGIDKFFVAKHYSDVYDGVNDAFVGLSVMNRLCREVPNFVYTMKGFYLDGEYVVIKENLKNTVPLSMYRGDDLHNIMIQICMSLQLAYERCCFTHNNLEPRKVLIQTLDRPIKIVYRLAGKTWMLDTKSVAIITDYSQACVLTDWQASIYKPYRMFVGNMNKTHSIDDILHVRGDKDVKYLVKKLGRKLYNKLTDDVELEQPIDAMSKLVTKTDIKKNKIHFGASVKDDEYVSDPPPRLLYDKITKEEEPHKRVVDRIMNNPLPHDDSGPGSVVLQYELVQTLRCTLADLNVKFAVDLITSERLKASIEFIKQQYADLIERSIVPGGSEDDGWSLLMFLRAYMKPLMETSFAKSVLHTLKDLAMYVVRDAIALGIKNTRQFYS